MTALVRGVTAAARAGAEMLKVASSGSTGTGRAPTAETASQVAMNVLDGTSTSSPSPMPRAVRQRRSASNPFPTPTQPATPTKSANSRSKASHSGPRMYRPPASTASMRGVS